MGTFVMIAWFIVLGPLAALLLGGIAYSMFVDNLEAGLICGFLLFLPLLLTLAWGAATLSESRRKGKSQRASLILTTRPIKSALESSER
jgi:predicted lipid-binding transport protein (Tim44 family)